MTRYTIDAPPDLGEWAMEVALLHGPDLSSLWLPRGEGIADWTDGRSVTATIWGTREHVRVRVTRQPDT